MFRTSWLLINLLPQAGFLWRHSCPIRLPSGYAFPRHSSSQSRWVGENVMSRETERGGACTRLMLHWDPLIDDIQRTHVSRWSVEVVQEAYTRADLEYEDDIRAHELRATASSWAYVNQVRLEDILAAASWRSSGVFQGSYLRDMSSIVDGMATLGPIVAAQHVVCTRRQ